MSDHRLSVLEDALTLQIDRIEAGRETCTVYRYGALLWLLDQVCKELKRREVGRIMDTSVHSG